jgi:hypothetical protein
MIIRNTTTIDNIESRKVLCKALTSINFYTHNNVFPKDVAVRIILKTVKLRRPSYDMRKYTAEPPSVEQANNIFNIMYSRGYLEYSHSFKKLPGYPQKFPDGTKLYRAGQLRVTECEETSWYKNRERKEKYLTKERELDTRRCKALQQIYSMFGYMPFSYNTVKLTANSIINLTHKNSPVKFTKAEKVAIDHMKTKLYSYDEQGFIRTWQSLIANNYIIPHKIKTPDGYVKNTGLYKINPVYLKQCVITSV